MPQSHLVDWHCLKKARTSLATKSESGRAFWILVRSRTESGSFLRALPCRIASSIAAQCRIRACLKETTESCLMKGCSPGATHTSASDQRYRVQIGTVMTSPDVVGWVRTTCRCSFVSSSSSIMKVSPQTMADQAALPRTRSVFSSSSISCVIAAISSAGRF